MLYFFFHKIKKLKKLSMKWLSNCSINRNANFGCQHPESVADIYAIGCMTYVYSLEEMKLKPVNDKNIYFALFDRNDGCINKWKTNEKCIFYYKQLEHFRKNLLPNLSFTIILSFSDFTTSTFMVLKRFCIEAEGVWFLFRSHMEVVENYYFLWNFLL